MAVHGLPTQPTQPSSPCHGQVPKPHPSCMTSTLLIGPSITTSTLSSMNPPQLLRFTVHMHPMFASLGTLCNHQHVSGLHFKLGNRKTAPSLFASLTLSKGMSSGLPPVMPPADIDRKGTADLADVFMPEPVDQICTRKVNAVTPGLFKDLGGKLRFSGQVSTVRCFENNPLVRKAVGEPGEGRVLVVDGGASLRCALLGDQLAATAVKNGWSGIIVNGCIRDSEDIGAMPLGVKALATHPLKSSKRDPGLRDVPVTFGGVTFKPGDWVYADKDGILVSTEELKL